MLEAVSQPRSRFPICGASMLFTLAHARDLPHYCRASPSPALTESGLQDFIENNQLLGMLNLFSGSGLQNFSIVALGVYPYITASIIMQLMTPIIPRLNELSNGRPAGAEQDQSVHPFPDRSARVAAGLRAGDSLLAQIRYRRRAVAGRIRTLRIRDTLLPTLAILLSMTAGTMLLVWMGELITEIGIGNGVSIIIFGGIVAHLPATLGQLVRRVGRPSTNIIGSRHLRDHRA